MPENTSPAARAELTVHFDDGSKPVFEKFTSRADAENRVRQVASTGRIAIILEDWS